MPTLRFKAQWRADMTRDRLLLLPTVPISITLGDGSQWHTQAIVDSAADRTLIAAEALTNLGLSYEVLASPRLATSATRDKFEVRRLDAQVSLRVPDQLPEFSALAASSLVFAHSLDVAEPKRYAHSVPLVGRRDFFQAFDVRFLWRACVIEVWPRSP
ncbi:MAG: hypothetical protein JXA57_20150 [Armatimonadetes bacterium]|nr:hypothetical protein [Armatimonadota bacterium]